MVGVMETDAVGVLERPALGGADRCSSEDDVIALVEWRGGRVWAAWTPSVRNHPRVCGWVCRAARAVGADNPIMLLLAGDLTCAQ